MAILYLARAVNDLRSIIRYGVDHDLPDPVAYVLTLRQKIEHQHAIQNPGVKGRKQGTIEWILAPLPYIAVVKNEGVDVKVYRVLPGKAIKLARTPT